MTLEAMLRRIGPRSLSGQIVLLVVVALFVAQAINFALLLNERRAVRLEQVTVPAVTRVVDAAERLRSGRFRQDQREEQRGRDGEPSRQERSRGVRLQSAPDTRAEATRDGEFEQRLRRALIDANLPVNRIVTDIRPVERDDPRLRKMNPRRADRLRALGATLTVSAEIPGRGWLVLETPWPNTERFLVWQLFAQTLILYGVVLLPVLWIGRRISRPLRELAGAARDYRPGGPTPALVERGPGDVRAVTAAFNGMAARVGAMLDEKDRMLGAIGHDLRTPLAALRVRIESVEDDADRQRMAETIDDMNRTLEDILSLARLGRSSEPPVDVDLAALVDAVVEDFRDLGADVDLAEGARTPLRLRPTLMRRAVRNLIENAVKYAGAAEVRLVSRAQEVVVEIADRGPGIPDDQLDAVFQPFTRLEQSRNRDTGGAGLGLALTRAIVGEAGGRVTLANRPGGGVLATIALPRP